MRTLLSPALALVSFSFGCTLPATARTGELTRGLGGGEVALPIVAREPQSAVDADGVRSKSNVSFFPTPVWSARARISHCEVGGSLMMRDLVELRCGALQESEGEPLSIASSVAAGWNIKPSGPWARVGIDVSKRFGVVAPMLDAYLSYGPELHYMNRTIEREGDPREGPFPPSTSLERRELRASVPFGVAFRIVDGDVRTVHGWNDDFTKPEIQFDFDPSYDLVFGATAWWVLRSSPIEQSALFYEAERGLAFTIGLEVR